MQIELGIDEDLEDWQDMSQIVNAQQVLGQRLVFSCWKMFSMLTFFL
jgi:hypothetical protein